VHAMYAIRPPEGLADESDVPENRRLAALLLLAHADPASTVHSAKTLEGRASPRPGRCYADIPRALRRIEPEIPGQVFDARGGGAVSEGWKRRRLGIRSCRSFSSRRGS
jgi:hypothetical protein